MHAEQTRLDTAVECFETAASAVIDQIVMLRQLQ
jgi:hypothetical protein